MLRTITESYGSREKAEAARERLIAAGFQEERITLTEPASRIGAFDHLTRLLSAPPSTPASDWYRLKAEVPSSRYSHALLAVRGKSAAAGPQEQVFEFPEYREELRVRRQNVVKEEVVMRREVQETVADVHGTIRRTEIEVEQIPPSKDALRFGLR